MTTKTGFSKYFPIVLVGISLILFGTMIARYETHLANSQPMYVKLQPSDPRSLLQGDYMTLNYGLNFSENYQDNAQIETFLKNNHRLTAWVVLDDKRKVVKSVLNQKQLAPNETAYPLQLNNPDNSLNRLYPSAKSFMFAEGLADCYSKATYALFKVNSQGAPILADLVGDDLKHLDCEK